MVKRKKTEKKVMEIYRNSIVYVVESKNFIYFGMGIFLLFFIFGLIFPTPLAIEEFIKKILKEILFSFQGLDGLEIIAAIFWNNLSVVFFGLVFGIFFGIVPFFSLVVNGYVVGYVVKNVVIASESLSLLKMIPYGIFELFAIFVGLGLGIKLGFSLFTRAGTKLFFQRLKITFKILLFIILPLLLLAAAIEGWMIIFLG